MGSNSTIKSAKVEDIPNEGIYLLIDEIYGVFMTVADFIKSLF